MKWIVQHAAWLIRIVESCWNSVNLCLLTFQRWEKDLGIPRRSWDRWKSAVRLGKSDLTDQLTKELYAREAYDDSPATAGQKKTFEQLSKHHRSRRRRQRTSLLQPNLSLLLLEHQKYLKMTAEPEEDEEMQVKPSDTKETPRVSSSSRGEKGTETQENVFVKKRLLMKSPTRPATPVTPSDDPVERQRHAHASGNRRFGSAEHGEHSPQRRDW